MHTTLILDPPTGTAGIGDPTTTAHLRIEQQRTLTAPRRRYGLAARALFGAMEAIYGSSPSLPTFRVLEIVARVPYQAWEHVAYVAVTHTHEQPDLARSIHDRVVQARAEQDNEQWHLLIIEELLQRNGFRHRPIRDRVIPQVLAFVYYQLSWLLYVARPAWSYRLNADFEDHAEHTYMEFVAANPDLDDTPWESQFTDDYGHHPTVGDLFRRIGLDEREHKDASVARLTHPRFGRRLRRPATRPAPTNHSTKENLS